MGYRLTTLLKHSSKPSVTPINDTRHPELHKVKTGQNRPPLQGSASLRRAVDSPECWWDGKLTDTKVAISDSDRCLLESWVSKSTRSTEFLLLSTWPCVKVFTSWGCVSSFIQTKPQQLTHPSLHRGVAQKEDWPMLCQKGRLMCVGRLLLCCCFVSGDAKPDSSGHAVCKQLPLRDIKSGLHLSMSKHWQVWFINIVKIQKRKRNVSMPLCSCCSVCKMMWHMFPFCE